MTEARSDHLCLISGVVKPGLPAGTTKPRMPLPPSSSPVCAQTIATPATEPLVIHILRPVRIQSSPSRLAYVRIPAGSEPWSGSVRPKQPMISPAAMPGSQRRFCSSDPKRWIAYMAREPWTETRERIPESAASSSRQASPYWTAVAPAQPYPVRDMPSAPSEPSSRASSRMAGSSPFSYHSAMCGRTRSAAQARTASRIARSSGSRRSSMPRGSPASNGGSFDGFSRCGGFADSVVDIRMPPAARTVPGGPSGRPRALRKIVPRQATFASSRRPARTLAAPVESPSTSSTRTSVRHAESTHQTPLLDGKGCLTRH
ncbi:hypothetical protein ACVWXU_007291 [Streptomyces sp. TE33382]